MKKFEQLGKSLSKQEQKSIMGGNFPPDDNTLYCSCDCSGSVGSWIYTNGGVNRKSAEDDLGIYCRSGAGSCHPC